MQVKPHQVRNQNLMFEMPKWGLSEIEYLISYFQTEKFGCIRPSNVIQNSRESTVAPS